MRRISFLLITALLMGGCSGAAGPAEYARTEPLMSTYVQVKASSIRYSAGELKNIVEAALSLARDMDEKLSVYRPGSELNGLNLSKKRKVSRELYALLERSKMVSSLTEGEFDVTVAPVLKRNGFYDDMPREILDNVPAELSGVGWRNIELNAPDEARLLNGAWVDLSGIAKGYIVDVMSSYLEEKGVSDFMVNAGGDIYCGSKRGGPWKVGLRRPGGEEVLMALDVERMAVATSGDYENVVFDENTGKALSHIIDPSGDLPMPEVPSSVTVIASECALADALATGMMAMGPERALDLADRTEGVEIIAVGGSPGGDEILFSKNAEKFVSWRQDR